MTTTLFEHIEIRENDEPLVDLAGYPFVREPFYHQNGLSDDPRLYLREATAEKLVTIQGKLGGRKFKIWDAWRPRRVQANIYQLYWNSLQDQHPNWSTDELTAEVGKFVTVADRPQRIPPHATGGAVDLTLVEAHGTQVEMGTVFDHFGPEAASLYFEAAGRSKTVRENRRILREAMTAEGFRADDDEWWHFDYGNQLWAANLKRPYAIYGEKDCAP